MEKYFGGEEIMEQSQQKCPQCGKELTKGEKVRGVCADCKTILGRSIFTPTPKAPAAERAPAGPVAPKPPDETPGPTDRPPPLTLRPIAPSDEAGDPQSIPAPPPYQQAAPQTFPGAAYPPYAPPYPERAPRRRTSSRLGRLGLALTILAWAGLAFNLFFFMWKIFDAIDKAGDAVELEETVKVYDTASGLLLLLTFVPVAGGVVVAIVACCLRNAMKKAAIAAIIVGALFTAFVLTKTHQTVMTALYKETLIERMEQWREKHPQPRRITELPGFGDSLLREARASDPLRPPHKPGGLLGV
jgi:transcription initiation factor TFIIIB Brf1 subunit/transcription initiation factor TFIIB